MRNGFIAIIGIICSFLSPISAMALTEAQLDYFAQNNILFYDPSEAAECDPATISGSKVTVIGDSISVGAESEYASQLSGADYEAKTFSGVTYNLTEVSKHFAADAGTNYSGMTIARVLQEQGVLRPYVVFALGTNDPGAVTEAAIQQLMDLVGTNHKVVLVTNYATDGSLDYSVNNAAIRAAAEKYNNVAVADWAKAASGNEAKYFADNVHPNAEGSQVFVKTIKAALNELASGASSGVSTGNNRNYAGAQVWSDSEMQAIEANKPFYQEAAELYDFPWQVMAVVHSLENGLSRTNPANYVGGIYSQGLYGFYNETGGGYKTHIVDSEFGTMTMEIGHQNTDAEFMAQTKLAARILRQTMDGNGWDFNDSDDLKRLFVSYNGAAGVYQTKGVQMGYASESDDIYIKAAEGSAYVMNRYDAERDPTSDGMSPLWPGRFVADGVYDSSSTTTGFGAFVKYEAIAGASYCSGSVDGGLTEEQAQKLADYYNGPEVDASLLVLGMKDNCVSFSGFFVNWFTSAKDLHAWPNGKDVANYAAQGADLETGTDVRPYSLFSVTRGSTVCEDGYLCGHTGIVVGVEGDDIITVEAAYRAFDARVFHRDISYFVNDKYGDTFTYLETILDQAALAEVVGR